MITSKYVEFFYFVQLQILWQLHLIELIGTYETTWLEQT